MKYLKESLKYTLRSRFFIRNEIKKVENLYTFGEDALEQYKEEQFLTLFRHAITNSKFYQKFYSEAGIQINDIQSLRDIYKLPILTKETLRDNYIDILTTHPRKVLKTNTSGTTGTPLTIFHSYKTIKTEQAYIWVRRKKYGFNFGEPLLSLRGNLGHDRFKLYIHASNTLFLSSYNINNTKVKKYYEEIKKFRPKAIEAYPSSLYNLCLLFKELRIRLNIPLVFTSSETLYDFQRVLIEEVLNAKIFDRYGCTERTISLAQNMNRIGYYEEPGYSINEFQDDSILTTSLINESFPLIRYMVNDKIDFQTEENKYIINSILGRSEDIILCFDGTQIGRIDHIFKGVHGILLAQIIQNKQGYIDINIVPNENYSESSQNEIIKNLHKRIHQANISVKVNLISKDEITYSSRNKYSMVISKIN